MKKNSKNPLKMERSSPESPFVLPKQTCSERRKEFFGRSNRILCTYMIIAAHSNRSHQSFEESCKTQNLTDSTSIRIKMGTRTIQCKRSTFIKMFNKAGSLLTNQIFLMIYGNFESFLSDLVQDAFSSRGSTDPIQDTISILITSKWESKIQKIRNSFGIDLKGRVFKQKYQNIKMGFFGEPYDCPVTFMESMSDMRHRLVHSSGRVDKKLLEKYPKLGKPEGELIELPFGFPYDLNSFFVPLTDIFDDVFCNKFGWQREKISPEQLVDI